MGRLIRELGQRYGKCQQAFEGGVCDDCVNQAAPWRQKPPTRGQDFEICLHNAPTIT